MSRPLVVGHRGAGGLAPENTPAAFERGILEGAEIVECDVRASRDGEIFVFHDADLGRLAGMPGICLRDLESGEIRERVRIAGTEPVPTLGELCQAITAQRRGLFVEIKEPAITDAVLDILSGFAGRFPSGWLVCGGFDPGVVKQVASAGDWITAIQLATDDEDYGAAHWLYPGFSLAGLPIRSAKPEVISLLRARGFRIWFWTANSPEEIQKAIELGAEAIISDFPARAKTIVDQRFS